MDFVDEQNDLARAGLHLINDLAQALFKLALHAGTGLQQAHVQRVDRHIAQRRRHVVGHHARGKALDHSRLADPGLARQQRVVLAAAQQNIDDLADLVVAPGDRIKLALTRLLGQVHRIFFQRTALAALGTAHGLAGLARLRAAGHAAAIAGGLVLFGRRLDDLHQIGRHHVGLQLAEFARHALQHRAQVGGFQQTDHQIATTDHVVAIQQRRVDPGTLDGRINVLGKIHNRRRTARQAVQLGRDVLFQRRGIELVVLENVAEIRILILDDLMHPMHQLHIRIAPQLARHRGSLRCPEHLRVQLAEQMIATNF
ncbi:hypothetical protein SDC9_136267 [bioreactor metagenome]|uniref:Uncharacterized protein n=1 Tax=bioreactor metagenome TaxID=1076179 RepID=A0A645DIP3_9ZZZZ